MAIAPISRLGRACAFPLGVVAVALLLMPLVFHAFYTSFQDYDDEGYLLMSLRDYARGGPQVLSAKTTNRQVVAGSNDSAATSSCQCSLSAASPPSSRLLAGSGCRPAFRITRPAALLPAGVVAITVDILAVRAISISWSMPSMP